MKNASVKYDVGVIKLWYQPLRKIQAGNLHDRLQQHTRLWLHKQLRTRSAKVSIHFSVILGRGGGVNKSPDSKVHGANMGPIWGR